MYNRDRDREEFERWHRFGRERGWFEKGRDEIASWFGDDDAERRRKLDRMEHERERSSERFNDRYASNESMYGHERFGTWPDSSQMPQYRRDTEYGNRQPLQDRFSERYSERHTGRHMDEHEVRPYEGNWGPTRGRESEFTTGGTSYLAPWAGSNPSSLREMRGRRGPRNYRRSDERISDDIHDKIDRHLDIDAREVIIEVKDGEVTIRGVVFSRADKRLAEEIAEDVFGVKNVQNLLRVNREESIPGELGTTNNTLSGENRLTGKR